MGGHAQETNADKIRRDMEDAAAELMSLTEMRKRIKDIVGRGTRLHVDIDEVRQFNPRLSQYIVRSPIEAIAIFERILN